VEQLFAHVRIRKSPNYCGGKVGKVDLNSAGILEDSGGITEFPPSLTLHNILHKTNTDGKTCQTSKLSKAET